MLFMEDGGCEGWLQGIWALADNSVSFLSEIDNLTRPS
jgi:hypothetical protein